jgi:hypothetical protein
MPLASISAIIASHQVRRDRRFEFIIAAQFFFTARQRRVSGG